MAQIDYQTDIINRGLEGKIDAEIVAVLSVVSVRDIPVVNVRVLLRERELWLKDPISRARNFGSIGQAMQAPTFPVDLYAALVALEAALYDDSATDLSTSSDGVIAERVARTVTGLQSVGAMALEDVAAFYDLGGGLRFPTGVAEADVVAARAAHVAAENQRAADEALDEARRVLMIEVHATWNEHLSPAISAADRTALIAGLRAMADALTV